MSALARSARAAVIAALAFLPLSLLVGCGGQRGCADGDGCPMPDAPPEPAWSVGGGASDAAGAQSAGQTAAEAQVLGKAGKPIGGLYEKVVCGESTSGLALCTSDSTLVLCSGGMWYAVECPSVGEGRVCAVFVSEDTTVADAGRVACIADPR